MADTPLPPVTAVALAQQLRTAVDRHLDIVTSMQQRAQQLKGAPTPPGPPPAGSVAQRRS
jgi:hypothetical protein